MRHLPKLIVVFLLMLVSFQLVAAAGPDFTVTSPKDGAVINSTSLTVGVQANNFNILPSKVPLPEAGKHPELNQSGAGHYHLALDLRPLVILDNTGSYTYTNVPPGDHQLMIELVNIDHSSFTSPLVKQMKFRTTGTETLPQTGDALSFRTTSWLALLILILASFILTAGLLVLRRKNDC